MSCFHNHCGRKITLLNRKRTALRKSDGFNDSLVFSEKPLINDELFEVKIDEKIAAWCGNLEIGVIDHDPTGIEFPICASKFKKGVLVVTGRTLVKNGNCINHCYAQDVDQLKVNDTIGVMRTSKGEVMFFINGKCQGVADTNAPEVLYAMVDIYGTCTQVTITLPLEPECSDEGTSNTDTTDSEWSIPSTDLRNLQMHSAITAERAGAGTPSTASICSNTAPHTNLKLYTKPTTRIKLSNNNLTAERRRPFKEFNNSVVTTDRALFDEEVFEIRLDKLNGEWSKSIEIGVTTQDPKTMTFPDSMIYLESGTILMSGHKIIKNGEEFRKLYGSYNLDELQQGDRVAVIRKSNGNLHFFINGLDQNVADTQVPRKIWGFANVYGRTMKITLITENNREESDIIAHRLSFVNGDRTSGERTGSNYTRLLFHENCGIQAKVFCYGRKARRLNAKNNFNNAIVMTTRPLLPGEMFVVYLERMIQKWAGTIEIGVTLHSAAEARFPQSTTTIRSRSWLLTCKGVMHGGNIELLKFGQKLENLKKKDRIGVVRMHNGNLHLYINDIDQGLVADNVPKNVYGIIDLCGKVTQVKIEERIPICSDNSTNILYRDLRFHNLHGPSVIVINKGKTALRLNPYAEFNESIVVSNRPLREGELFEVVMEELVEKWSGSVEIGLTVAQPNNIEFPILEADLYEGYWMLSGSTIIRNGNIFISEYNCDIDFLPAGTRLGVLRNADSTVEFFINGESQGIACEIPSSLVYGVVDVYGKCCQVSIVTRTPVNNLRPPTSMPDIIHKFATLRDKNVNLTEENSLAPRSKFSLQCLIFSASALIPGEFLKILLLSLASQYSGSIKIGVIIYLPTEIFYNLFDKSKNCWYISCNEKVLSGGRIALQLALDNCLKIFINSQELGTFARNLPQKIHAVIELCSTTKSIRINNKSLLQAYPPVGSSGVISPKLEKIIHYEFHENHGQNIKLFSDKKTAKILFSYNQRILMTSQPLIKGKILEINIKEKWLSSQMCGVISYKAEGLNYPKIAFDLKKPGCEIISDWISLFGDIMKSDRGNMLDEVKAGNLVAIILTEQNEMLIYINGIYGQCQKVSLLKSCSETEEQSLVQISSTSEIGQLDLQHCDKAVVKSEGTEGCENSYSVLDLRNCHRSGSVSIIFNPILNCLSSIITYLENNMDCEYMKKCAHLKEMLAIPDTFFLNDKIICYCPTCYPYIRHIDENYKILTPEYIPPIGWVKLPLRGFIDRNPTNCHTGFYGSTRGKLMTILLQGQPHAPEHLYPFNVRGLYEKMDTRGTLTSFYSSVEYATKDMSFVCMHNNKKQIVSIAFQLLLKPESFSNNGPVDDGYIEWTTKETDAITLHALLFKVQEE